MSYQLEKPDLLPRIGAVLLASDLTTEADFSYLFAADAVRLHYSRVANINPTTPENLIRMAPRLTAATDLLVPGEKLAAIYYSCTSAAAVIGEVAVRQAMQSARPRVPVVTPTLAVLRACAALGVHKIAFTITLSARNQRRALKLLTEARTGNSLLRVLGHSRRPRHRSGSARKPNRRRATATR